jgi:hypothetical protein
MEGGSRSYDRLLHPWQRELEREKRVSRARALGATPSDSTAPRTTPLPSSRGSGMASQSPKSARTASSSDSSSGMGWRPTQWRGGSPQMALAVGGCGVLTRRSCFGSALPREDSGTEEALTRRQRSLAYKAEEYGHELHSRTRHWESPECRPAGQGERKQKPDEVPTSELLLSALNALG